MGPEAKVLISCEEHRHDDKPNREQSGGFGTGGIVMNRKKNIITRRDLLEKGMAAATIGAAGLRAAPSVGKAQGPAVVTRRRFRAWISRGDGQGRTTLHEVT